MNVTTQNRKRKIGRGIVGGLLLAAVAGCGPVSKEDQERILLSEPGFARVMEQKKEVDRKIGWAKAEFAGESTKIVVETLGDALLRLPKFLYDFILHCLWTS